MNKTVGMYILELDSDIIQKYITNVRLMNTNIQTILNRETFGLCYAVSIGFEWDKSNEGKEYWSNLSKSCKNL